MPILNALTIDVEDYFHVHAFSKAIDPAQWDSFDQRVERNTHRVLDLLDEASVQPAQWNSGDSRTIPLGRSAFREPQGPEQSRRAFSVQGYEKSRASCLPAVALAKAGQSFSAVLPVPPTLASPTLAAPSCPP